MHLASTLTIKHTSCLLPGPAGSPVGGPEDQRCDTSCYLYLDGTLVFNSPQLTVSIATGWEELKTENDIQDIRSLSPSLPLPPLLYLRRVDGGSRIGGGDKWVKSDRLGSAGSAAGLQRCATGSKAGSKLEFHA